VHLLSVIEQNPGTDWRKLIGEVDVERDTPPDAAEITDESTDGDLATFRL
jgi:hypothetical protein